MTLISYETTITFTLPCEIPQTFIIGLYPKDVKYSDGNTIIIFYDAESKESHLRKLQDLIGLLCDKFPDTKIYKRLRSDVAQMIHNCSF